MFFNCQCVCGSVKVVKLDYLKNGHTISCGCMRGKNLPKREKDDLTGMKFGLWTVLYRDTEATAVAPRYICQCECGTVKSVDKYALKNGKSWHCGCQSEKVRKEVAQTYIRKFHAGEYEQKPAEMIGRRYGKLTVLSKIGDGASSKSSFVCQCDCGNKIVVSYQNLANQKGRRSCGCLDYTDLTGRRFGKLVVEERVTAAEAGKESNRHFWKCKCDCGKTTYVDGSSLLNGVTKSCGCLREGPRENLTGRRFGRLVVKGWIPDEKKGVIWECQCDCGGSCFAQGSLLKRGNVISCGCFSKETAKIIGNAARANSGAVEGTNVKLIQGAMDGKMYATNTSGIRGVGLDRKTGKWTASISFKNKTYYVDDIVEGVKRVMMAPPEKKVGEDGLPVPPYAVYNIGNNHPENLLDFVDILQQELLRAGVLPEDYDFEAHKKLVPMQPGDVPVTYADTSALERDFGFKPSTSLRDGLRKFAEWYKEFYKI